MKETQLNYKFEMTYITTVVKELSYKIFKYRLSFNDYIHNMLDHFIS